MKISRIFAIATATTCLLLFSAARCFVAADESRTVEKELTHEGRKRTYRLYLPAGAKKPLPLVLSLHGAGVNGAAQEWLTNMNEIADKEQFAIVYPDALNSFWRFFEPAENDVLRLKPVDDLGFLESLIDEMVKEGIADPRRVYVTGMSNGGYMANFIGRKLSNKVAAIAPVAGTMPRMLADKVAPKRPVPVLYIHGTDDTFVYYNGKDFITRQKLSLGAEEMVQWWVKHNKCKTKPVIEKLPDKADDGATVERFVYPAGKSKAPVVFYKVHNGGHTWPGGSLFQPKKLLGLTCRDFNASKEIWEFFKQYQLPARP
ncbi:MAG: hydrolase [Gemmatales bacterium]|nr:MAG: hydrolase [Gemmatales bacterium]